MAIVSHKLPVWLASEALQELTGRIFKDRKEIPWKESAEVSTCFFDSFLTPLGGAQSASHRSS